MNVASIGGSRFVMGALAGVMSDGAIVPHPAGKRQAQKRKFVLPLATDQVEVQASCYRSSLCGGRQPLEDQNPEDGRCRGSQEPRCRHHELGRGPHDFDSCPVRFNLL